MISLENLLCMGGINKVLQGSFGGGNVLLVGENLRSDFDYFIHFKAKNNIMGMLNIN